MKAVATALTLAILFLQVSAQESPEPTFKVDVKLVNVYVTVTDQQGAPIGNLTKNDFSLSEDGVPQKISVFSKDSQGHSPGAGSCATIHSFHHSAAGRDLAVRLRHRRARDGFVYLETASDRFSHQSSASRRSYLSL